MMTLSRETLQLCLRLLYSDEDIFRMELDDCRQTWDGKRLAEYYDKLRVNNAKARAELEKELEELNNGVHE